MIENRNFSSPSDMAWHLASYVTCASSIASFTANHFGKGRGVSPAKAKGMIDARQKKRLRKDVHGEEFDQAESDSLNRRNREMAKASSDFGRAVRLAAQKEWPCGHHRAPETTHWIAGMPQCRVCRRARWNAGFRKVVHKEVIAQERRRALLDGANVEKNRPKARREKLAQILQDYAGRLPVPELMFCVATVFKITAGALKGPSRHRTYVHARAVVIKILHERGCSYPLIAQKVGRSDHSTIIHAIAQWDVYVARDPRVLKAYEMCRDDEE